MAALVFSYISIRLRHFPTSFSLHLGYLFLERGVGPGTSTGGNAFTRRWTSLVSHGDGTGICGSQPHTPLLSKSDSSKDAALRALLRTSYFPSSQHHGGQREPSQDDTFVKIANMTITTTNITLTLQRDIDLSTSRLANAQGQLTVLSSCSSKNQWRVHRRFPRAQSVAACWVFPRTVCWLLPFDLK